MPVFGVTAAVSFVAALVSGVSTGSFAISPTPSLAALPLFFLAIILSVLLYSFLPAYFIDFVGRVYRGEEARTRISLQIIKRRF